MAASSAENIIQKKKIKKHKTINCFSINSCFGFGFSKNSQDTDDYVADNKKSLNNGSKRSSNRAKTVPVNDSALTMKALMVGPSKEIHVLDPEESDHHHRAKDQEASSNMLGKTKSSSKSTIMPQQTENHRRKLPHSFSMPLPRLKREKSTSSRDGRSKGKDGNELILEDEFEPLVGALILLVVLIVMLIWGKLYAILCAAMWFYFIPRCNNNVIITTSSSSSSTVMKLETKESTSSEVDVNSKEHKQRVVLEGLLERNQRVRV